MNHVSWKLVADDFGVPLLELLILAHVNREAIYFFLQAPLIQHELLLSPQIILQVSLLLLGVSGVDAMLVDELSVF